MAYEQQIFVHFDQCDPAGIVFYGNYAGIGHRVLESLLQSLGIPWKEWFDHDDRGVPIRHLEIEYLKPLFAGHTYKVKASVADIGSSSVKFVVEVTDPKGAACTIIRTGHVFINTQTLRPISIPAEIRDKLEKGK